MQPAKPSTVMTPPTTTNSHTGSRPPRSVSAEILERTPCAGRTEASGGADPLTILTCGAAPHPNPASYLLTPGPEANGQEQGSQHLQEQKQRVESWGTSILLRPRKASLSQDSGSSGGEKGRGRRAVNRIQDPFYLPKNTSQCSPHSTQPRRLNTVEPWDAHQGLFLEPRTRTEGHQDTPDKCPEPPLPPQTMLGLKAPSFYPSQFQPSNYPATLCFTIATSVCQRLLAVQFHPQSSKPKSLHGKES